MQKAIKGFRHLLISAPALAEDFGRQIANRFASNGLPVTECPCDQAARKHELAQKNWSLIVLFEPSVGWIKLAEHGSLAVRDGERYLNPILGCQSSCTYCYLRAHPVGLRPLKFHVGLQSLMAAIEMDRALHPGQHPLLYCTGELADSLGDADIYPIGAILAGRFAKMEDCVLELRTKSDQVGALLDLDHNGKTTVAFTITAETHIGRYEPGTAGLDARLKAARACQEAGYPVAFKFEPVIVHDRWQDHYRDAFDRIRRFIRVGYLDHVSIGCLRWNEKLAQVSTFEKQHRAVIRNGVKIPYRDGQTNSTLALKERTYIYEWMRRQVRQCGISAPIWWSLEDPELIRLMVAVEA